jgi:hypothetical protein
MESFFGTLKTELVRWREYPDRDAARRDLFAYIEGYYNRQRIHSAIGSITPPIRQRRNPHNPVSTLPGEAQLTMGGTNGQVRTSFLCRRNRAGSPEHRRRTTDDRFRRHLSGCLN